jgi:hypothetical protein
MTAKTRPAFITVSLVPLGKMLAMEITARLYAQQTPFPDEMER